MAGLGDPCFMFLNCPCCEYTRNCACTSCTSCSSCPLKGRWHPTDKTATCISSGSIYFNWRGTPENKTAVAKAIHKISVDALKALPKMRKT